MCCCLPSFRRTLQRRNMMAADYRHIGGVENRLGRHYSRFSPFSPTPALADQSLAWRKLWNAGSNRRSRAKSGCMQFLVRGDDNFAAIASCWRFAAKGDSVIADDKDAHAGLLFTAALVNPLTLCRATK